MGLKLKKIPLTYVSSIFALAGIIWMATVLTIAKIPNTQRMSSRLDADVLFNIRENLHQQPPVDPKLKIFVMDDNTVAWNDYNPEITTKDWWLLLKNISRNKPRVILIDKLFGGRAYLKGTSKESPEKTYLDNIKSLETPIYIGSYPFEHKLEHKHSLTLTESQYGPESLLGTKNLPRFVDKLPDPYQVYGPNDLYEKIFNGVGYLTYEDTGYLSIFPFKSIRKSLLPHISMYAANEIKAIEGKLYIDNQPVPMDEYGRIYINHRPPQDFNRRGQTAHIRQLRPQIQLARIGKPSKRINKGDIVFIIPEFYTGGVDVHEGGPFGEIPGGLIHAQLMDSILSKRWLYPLHHQWAFTLAMGIIGVVIGYASTTLSFWGVLICIIILYTFITIGLFSFVGIIIPLILPILSILGTSLSSHAFKVWDSEMIRINLRQKLLQETIKRQEERSKKEILEERLVLGEAVQEMLLPKSLTGNFANFDYQMRYKPAGQMSGDWLFIWKNNHEHPSLIMGDVVGKGPAAALAVAVIINELKSAKEGLSTIENAIENVNSALIDHFSGKITTTLAAIGFDNNKGISFYNAGSPGWFFQIPNQPTRYLTMRSNPLGIDPNTKPFIQKEPVPEKAFIFTFSDGYMEGARGLKRLVRELGKTTFAKLNHDSIHKMVLKVGEEFRLEDDMTMVSVKVD